MKSDKKFRRIFAAAAVVAGVGVGAVAVAYAGSPSGKGAGKPPKNPTPVTTLAPDPPPPVTSNDADAEFVAMMIPHHFQATVMSELAADRSSSDALLAFSDRIGVEQTVEIGMMQNWQTWNDLEVTDAEMGYEMMLGMPMMLEQMGMATPAELDDLAASSGTDFDRLFLELMIEHHEGALPMFENVILNGSDTTLEYWANDMMSGQTLQLSFMEEMLAALG